MQQSEGEIIGIAVTVDKQQHLHKINKNHTLQKIIEDICTVHGKTCTNNEWGLKITHSPDNRLCRKYVTENNISELKDGCIVQLVGSINYVLELIFENFRPNVEQSNKLDYLVELCSDEAVIEEIKIRGYYNALPGFAMKSKVNDQYIYLISLNSLINYGIIPTIQPKFVHFLINIVKASGSDVNVIKISLDLLSKIIHIGDANKFIVNHLKVDDLISYFWDEDNPVIQLNTLKLLNNIIGKNEESRGQLIDELKLPKNKLMVYRHLTENAAKNQSLAHELCIYQTYILSSYRDQFSEEVAVPSNIIYEVFSKTEYDNSNRRATMIDFEEKDIRSRLTVFSSSSSTDRLSRASSVFDQTDSVLLRSRSHSMLSLFTPSPVKKLTSVCIEYFKYKYEKNYSMSVLENQYNPGFFTICDQITQLLCDLLHISKSPTEKTDLYIPLIFLCDEKKLPFFEELFCRALWILARTRRDMRAKVDEDHEKVLKVLKEQIRIALKGKPMELRQLTDELKKISYLEVFNNWEEESIENWQRALQITPSIRELKKKLSPNVESLIREQRLRIMHKGEYFPKLPEKKGKQIYWFVSLTRNNCKLKYGDYDPDTRNFTSSQTEFSINDIAHVVTERAARHVKDGRIRRPEVIKRCFSLLLKNEEGLDFLANKNETAQYWVDGFHFLLGKQPESEKYRDDLMTLLNMDINLHLLELQNIPLPQKPPPVPLLPPEYRVKPNVPPKSPNMSQSTVRKTMMNPDKV